VSDLSAMVQSTQGKIEFDTMDDSDSDQVIAALVSLAVRQCFAEHVVLEEGPEIVEAFNDRGLVHTGDDLPDRDYLACWPPCRPSTPGAAHRRARGERRRAGLGRRVRARGPLPHQATGQGRLGRPGPLPLEEPLVPVRYGYRRFGEGDDFDDLDVEEMLALLADDFMENGDLEEAMDRLLREGYTPADGRRTEGLRDLLEQARAKRRELERQADPDGEMQRYRDWLDEIEQTEDANSTNCWPTPRPPTTNGARRSRATSSNRRRCSAT
jgi:hypothetical protein